MAITKTAARQIVKLQDRIEHHAKVMCAHKAAVAGNPNINGWIMEKPMAYYEGLMFATAAALSDLLHDSNNYQGFMDMKVTAYDQEQEYPAYFLTREITEKGADA